MTSEKTSLQSYKSKIIGKIGGVTTDVDAP
jgi:hypothetical protein